MEDFKYKKAVAGIQPVLPIGIITVEELSDVTKNDFTDFNKKFKVNVSKEEIEPFKYIIISKGEFRNYFWVTNDLNDVCEMLKLDINLIA